MEEELEIPKWVEKIMRMWVRDAAKPLPKEVRDMWREVHRKKAEQLKQVDRDKLDGWQREWIQWLLESNEKAAQETQDEETGDSEDVPIWYENLTQVVVEAYTPTIKFKALLQGRPSQSMAITCGEWVGHEYMIWCEENMAVTAALERFPAELRDAIIRQNQYLKPQRLKMVNKALAIANQQSVKESRQFFRGYYLALDKGTLKETGEPSGSNYATPIHIAMFCFADFIPRLKNNRELLEWLKLVLGSTQSWSKESSQKRVEKIAQRLDLRLSPLK